MDYGLEWLWEGSLTSPMVIIVSLIICWMGVRGGSKFERENEEYVQKIEDKFDSGSGVDSEKYLWLLVRITEKVERQAMHLRVIQGLLAGIFAFLMLSSFK